MKNWKYLILLVPVVLFVAILFYSKKIIREDSRYISNLNLDLEGEIIDIYKLKQGHGFGIIKIKLRKSNLDYYRPLNENRYFGIIENGFGKIVVNNGFDFNVGDVFMLKGQHFVIYRDGKIYFEGQYGLPMNLIFNPFNEINLKIDRF